MKGTAILVLCVAALAVAKPRKNDLNVAGCPQDAEIVKFLPHEDCQKFYQCVGGTPIVQVCPNNLVFNTELDLCDWPVNVDCGDRDIVENRPEVDNNENDRPAVNGHSDPSLAQEICAAEGSDGILVAHEKCDHFYKCYRGKPAAISCPAGLLYQPKLEYCDWPENVDCDDRTNSEDKKDDNNNDNNDSGSSGSDGQGHSDPSEAPALCAAEGSDGILVAHEKCNHFYKCYRGKPAAISCPAGLLYQPKFEYCDWPENVNCGDRTNSEDKEDDNNNDNNNSGSSGSDGQGHSDPSEASALCAAEGSDGILVAHEKCNHFYKCYRGKPAAISCPAGLLYQPKFEYCDWPENVNCGDRTNSEDKEDDNNNDNNDSGSSGSDGQGHSDPSEAPALCAAEGSDGILVAHEKCDHFYKCYRGKPAAISCPAGLLYQPKFEYCDWPENVNCGDRTNSEDKEDDNNNDNNDSGSSGSDGQGHSDPSEAPALCAAEGSDGILVAHEKCNHFYKCYRGKPAAISCPAGLLYQPKFEYCDWPENVNCGDRTLSKNKKEGSSKTRVLNNGHPREASAICAAEGSDGILVAHEKCDHFYKCYRGKPAAISCPAGLLYQPKLEYCDWPENVNCGDRTNSEDKEDDNNNDNNDSGSSGSDGQGHSDPSEAPALCAAEGSDGILVAHEKCDHFYKCYRGKPAAISCPAGLLYQPKFEYCDWPENVNCGDRTNSEDKEDDNNNDNNDSGSSGSDGQGHSDPSEAPALCAAEGSDGILVAHEKCDHFYKCYRGKPAAISCPAGLLYQPKFEYCDWPENVNCGDRTNSEDKEDDNNNDNNDSGSSGSDGQGHSDPSEAPALCAAEGSDGILVAHEKCDHFYKCYRGKPAAISCPAGLLYQPKFEYCDWPENVNCGDRTNSEDKEDDNNNDNNDSGSSGSDGQGHSDPSEAPALCAAEGSDGILVAHEKCNHFYKCYRGKPAAISCPAGLLYQPKLEYCDWPENVDCGNRS